MVCLAVMESAVSRSARPLIVAPSPLQAGRISELDGQVVLAVRYDNPSVCVAELDGQPEHLAGR
jgi:hypothetical protein